MKTKMTFILLFNCIKYIVLSKFELNSKTLLTYSTDKCKSNPMLNLLSKEMKSKIEMTLLNKPSNGRHDFCKIPKEKDNDSILNCCSSFTYLNIKTYLNDYLHLPKQNIHERNLYYYKQLYDEHKRNLVQGFSFTESDFENIFSKLHYKIKEIIKISEDIVYESVQYNWDAFCNYICYYPSAIEQNCKIYQLNYTYNNINYDDYEYECKEDSNRVMKMTNLLHDFISIKNGLTETLNGYYKTIKTMVENNFKSKLEPQKFTLLMNSINDGNWVASDLNQPFLCSKYPVSYIVNDHLNYTIVNVDTSCETLEQNPCGIFSCLDDFFMQFFDVSEFNQSYIVKQFNYTKSKVIPSDDTDLFGFNYSDEISNLIDGRLQFNSEITIHSDILFIMLLLICLF